MVATPHRHKTWITATVVIAVVVVLSAAAGVVAYIAAKNLNAATARHAAALRATTAYAVAVGASFNTADGPSPISWATTETIPSAIAQNATVGSARGLTAAEAISHSSQSPFMIHGGSGVQAGWVQGHALVSIAEDGTVTAGGTNSSSTPPAHAFAMMCIEAPTTVDVTALLSMVGLLPASNITAMTVAA